MQTFTIEQTPAEIVKVYPKASDLFNKHQINFCCKGDRPLADVLPEKKLDEKLLLSELNTSYERWSKEENEVIDWDTLPLTKITNHIFDKHHTYLYEELAPIGQFVTKVARVHGAEHAHLKDLFELFHTFKAKIEEQMADEEADVFPLIEAYEKNPTEELKEKIQSANAKLIKEREEQTEILDKIREVTNNFTLPQGACNSYRITYARLEELTKETYEHIHLENNVLFKRVS
ncbi:iron-sulfur cluster repair di-iron protein [Oceanobacillus sp. CAU 1775]